MNALRPLALALVLALAAGCHSEQPVEDTAKQQGAELLRSNVTAPIDKAKAVAEEQEKHKQEADALSGQ